MFDVIGEAIGQINLSLFLLAGVLFVLGLVLADMVVEKEVRWLIAYPLWIYQKIEKLMNSFSNPLLSFFFIFFFNALNLFVGFASGFLVILPAIFAVWTGINIGVVMRKVGGDQKGLFFLIFLNPVALFELPASWIAFSAGLEIALRYVITMNYGLLPELFIDRLSLFLWVVLPLLAIAALIEAALIHIMQNKIHEKDNS